MKGAKKIKPFANQNGFTTFNNYILDHIMPNLAPNSWKVLCFIIRKTEGWNKDIDSLSFTQIMKGTGIKNRTTVSNAITDLEESRYIVVSRFDDTETPNEYRLNTALEIDDPSTEIVPAQEASTENVPAPSTEIVPTKETSLNKQSLSKDKDVVPAKPKPKKEGGGKKRPDVIPSFNIYVEETGYYGLNKQQRNIIHRTVGVDPASLETWRAVVRAWVLAGYKPINAKGMIDWFKNGIPDRHKPRNGAYKNGHKSQKRSATKQDRTIQGDGLTPEERARADYEREMAKYT